VRCGANGWANAVRGLGSVILLIGLVSLLSPEQGAAEEQACNPKIDPQLLVPAKDLIDLATWRICSAVAISLGSDLPRATAVLLRSAKPQDTSGTGNPLFGVDLLIAADGRTIYRFAGVTGTPKFYIDDALEIHDLSGRGDQAVLFHSGDVGASDWWTATHILFLSRSEGNVFEVAPESFGESWRQKMQWTTFRGIPLVVVAKPVSPASTVDGHFCHSCAKYYQYLVYRWSTQRLSFVIQQVVQSEHDVGADTDALSIDMPFIEKAIAKRW
jgi:hypothetical protein